MEAVRSAVERTFQASAEGAAGDARSARKQLVDEVANAAARVRETIEDLKVLEDVRGLRREIESLARRVGALEVRGAKVAPAAANAVAPGSCQDRGEAQACRQAQAGRQARRSSPTTIDDRQGQGEGAGQAAGDDVAREGQGEARRVAGEARPGQAHRGEAGPGQAHRPATRKRSPAKAAPAKPAATS